MTIFYSYHRVATEAINDIFVTGTLRGDHWYLVTKSAGQRIGLTARPATLQEGTDGLSRKCVTQYNQHRFKESEDRHRGGNLTSRNTQMFATYYGKFHSGSYVPFAEILKGPAPFKHTVLSLLPSTTTVASPSTTVHLLQLATNPNPVSSKCGMINRCRFGSVRSVT